MLRFLSDGQLLAFAGAALALCAVAFALTAHLHRRRLKAIPIRIHVAGTRGKTTVTRLIRAALREGGLCVVAKTTGTVPTLLLPDGSEHPWRRWGPASIAEQWRFIRKARRLDAQAVVLECMAIEPEFLWASERFALRATHTIVTNARPDHIEVLEESGSTMAQSLALVVPRGGKLVLAAEAALDPLLDAAKAAGSEVIIVETGGLSPDETNRTLALQSCLLLGVPAGIAERGMRKAGTDLGALQIADLNVGGRKLRFVSAFACNDVVSLRALWAAHRDTTCPRPHVLLNARSDRPERTRAFLAALRDIGEPVTLWIAGAGPRRLARAAGFASEEVHMLRGNEPQALLAQIAASIADRGEVWGVGNFHGLGNSFALHLARGSTSC